MKLFRFLIIVMVFSSLARAQEAPNKQVSDTASYSQSSINDGPYIFVENNKLIEKTIVDGTVKTKELAKGEYPLKFNYRTNDYKDIAKIAAISDLHGQFNLSTEILKNNGIIDDNHNWNFGKGHLVIVGDIFDRGDQVTELLWLIYRLENEAEKAGGKVHYLLGNHEYMVLLGDDRYVNPKYIKSAQLLGLSHRQLFGVNTVLGRWLRSKSTILKINNNVFVHGGISKNLLERKFKIEKINKAMVKEIDKQQDTIKKPDIDLYFSNDGPIWYRGYFYDNLPDSEISDILKAIESKQIVVGHCSNEKIVRLYDGQIFGVDSSIKLGEYGEVLFIRDNVFFRGSLNGERLEFSEE